MKVTEEMDRTKDSYSARQVAPSMDHSRHTYIGEARQLLPSEVGRRNLFSDTLN